MAGGWIFDRCFSTSADGAGPETIDADAGKYVQGRKEAVDKDRNGSDRSGESESETK